MDMKKWALQNSLVQIVAGSRLYGFARPDSDYDIRGVCLDSPRAILGIQGFEQYSWAEAVFDGEIYSISKFFNLAIKANPSILDILFAPPETWMTFDPIWEEVYERRKLFLSKNAVRAYLGYSFDQLKRINRHKKWIDDPPPVAVPERYGLYLVALPGGKQVLEPLPKRYKLRDWPMILATMSLHEKADPWHVSQAKSVYKQAQRERSNYETWMANRNPYRASLEKEYGYDTKHAAHLARLLIQLDTILLDGDYDPRMSPAAQKMVRAILNGEWDYQDLVDWAKVYDAALREADTSLPEKPQVHLINKIKIRMTVRSLMRYKPYISAMAGIRDELNDMLDGMKKDDGKDDG